MSAWPQFHFPLSAAPTIDPIPNASIPAGKSLIIPVTATSPNGLPLTFSATSSTNRITVQVHTNNPFWKMSVVQAASPAAPGAYPTPFRGGVETVTNIGDMTFMLFRDIAPHTVDVIQGLTAGGLYTSNTIFHRVIAGFMNQGGDPLTNGTGGPVFRYDDEFNPQAIFSGNGQLALANSGKDTDGSQFFITVAPYRSGDFGYTIFGQLLRGFNVLSNINNTAVDANSRPLADVIITKASLVPDNFDTVLTLVGTNQAGVAGTIKVIADDGAGGRTTNSFTATTVADANLEPAFLYPNTVTNLVAPVNKRLTNFVFGYDFPGVTNNWYRVFADENSYAQRHQFVLQHGHQPTAVCHRAEHELRRAGECHFLCQRLSELWDLRSADLYLCFWGHRHQCHRHQFHRAGTRTVLEPAYRHLYQRRSEQFDQ